MSQTERAGAIAFMVKTPVKDRKGLYQLATTRGAWATRAAAREVFAKSLGRGWTWRRCYLRGCRVVMVDINEVGGR